MKIHGLTDAAIIIASCLLLLGYCTPAPADEVEDRTERMFDRYMADSDRYADRLDRDERRREQETANLLLCGPGGSASLCRTYGSGYDQRLDRPRRIK